MYNLVNTNWIKGFHKITKWSPFCLIKFIAYQFSSSKFLEKPCFYTSTNPLTPLSSPDIPDRPWEALTPLTSLVCGKSMVLEKKSWKGLNQWDARNMYPHPLEVVQERYWVRVSGCHPWDANTVIPIPNWAPYLKTIRKQPPHIGRLSNSPMWGGCFRRLLVPVGLWRKRKEFRTYVQKRLWVSKAHIWSAIRSRTQYISCPQNSLNIFTSLAFTTYTYHQSNCPPSHSQRSKSQSGGREGVKCPWYAWGWGGDVEVTNWSVHLRPLHSFPFPLQLNSRFRLE